MDRAGFDPRYSPEFQRGFDASEAPSSTAESPERIDAGPSVRRIPPAPDGPIVPVPTAVAAVPAETAGRDDAAAADDAEALSASSWRNPYILALTVLGVLLILGGIGSFRWSVEQVIGGAVYEGGSSQAEMEEAMLAAQLSWGLAPLLALAGALTLLGVFFFVAWRWRPRPTTSEDTVDGVTDRGQAG
jgi:hypothetical protein